MNARLILFLLIMMPMAAAAQREANVHGKSELVVTDHDNISFLLICVMTR